MPKILLVAEAGKWEDIRNLHISLGHEVTQVTSVEDARKELASSEFDTVVCDGDRFNFSDCKEKLILLSEKEGEDIVPPFESRKRYEGSLFLGKMILSIL